MLRFTSKVSQLLLITSIGLSTSAVWAQDGQLPHPLTGPRLMRLPDSCWFYHQLPPIRQLQKHDIVTVVVNIRAQVLSEGEVERRKRSQADAVLSEWLRLDRFNVKPAPQRDGDLRVTGSMNSQYRAEGELETRDRMQFTIAAKVVDVRPNGNLVVEAQQAITNNREVWRQSLRGIVRPEDVLPNNRVLSEHIADLRIDKEETGIVPDTYRRGWLHRAWDNVRPF